VEIRDMKFEPDVLFAKTGDTVVFTNDDLVTHDVTEQNKAWTSSALAPGKSWSMVITGSVAYYCSIHVVMKGKIIVK
jgi:plastocyanin